MVPESKPINKYFPRLSHRRTIWPATVWGRCAGTGQRMRGSWINKARKHLPGMTVAIPRRVVSTSGSSGIGHTTSWMVCVILPPCANRLGALEMVVLNETF
jgi:hypothetical protein